MISLIVGVKGTGKTKTLLDIVHDALKNTDGNIVCIEKGKKMGAHGVMRHEVRMIDVEDYSISSSGSLYGLVCGLYANNFDITHIFIASALKICSLNIEDFTKFVLMAEKFATKNGVKVIMTVTLDKAALPENLHGFLVGEN